MKRFSYDFDDMAEKVRRVGGKVDDIVDLFRQARNNLSDIKLAFQSNSQMSHLTSYKRERKRFNEMKFQDRLPKLVMAFSSTYK